jgi:hypothetical protein
VPSISILVLANDSLSSMFYLHRLLPSSDTSLSRINHLLGKMPGPLPQEIVDITVDHFHDDYQMLKTFSLVSKSWLSSSRHHLFSCVQFRNYADLDCIERWMSSPHLSQLVQQIFIGCGTLSATKFSSTSLYSFSTEFRDEPLRWQSLVQIVTLFPRITSLKLDFVKFDTPPDAFRLVAGFSCLRQLQWINVRFENTTHDISHDIFPPSPLRDLCITCHDVREDAEQFLRWVSFHSPRIHLKSLAIEWSIGVINIAPFLSLWGTTLTALNLSGFSSRKSPTLSVFGIFNLNHATARAETHSMHSMTSLRRIRLPFIHLRHGSYVEDSHQWVYHLLSSISSPHIRTISLPLEVYYDLSDDDNDNDEENLIDSLENLIFRQLNRINWKRIDQVVITMKSWTSLQRIVIWMKLVETDFPAASRVMRRLLPSSIAIGIVVEARLWSADSYHNF